jgi:hypothetical protein
MQEMRSLGLATAVLLLVASLSFAGAFKSSIDELQARVDTAFERQAAADA